MSGRVFARRGALPTGRTDATTRTHRRIVVGANYEAYGRERTTKRVGVRVELGGQTQLPTTRGPIAFTVIIERTEIRVRFKT